MITHNTIEAIIRFFLEVINISGFFRRNTKSKPDKWQVANDVLCLPVLMVNVCLVGMPGPQSDWVLIDAGTTNSYDKIIKVAEDLFGKNNPPKAIILTHGHFDHVGSIDELLKAWSVQMYAHEKELPFLTGNSEYPPADPTVGGGMMSKISPVFSNRGVDLGRHIHALPANGGVPHMTGWRWIHTPGHSPGHISLFRDRDRVLLAGDAITTVKQESATAVLTRKQELHGPPAYLTIDWHLAWDSVTRLEALKPSVVASSHGIPMRDEELRQELLNLSLHFEDTIPNQGRYVDR